jgi:hypothetical protein
MKRAIIKEFDQLGEMLSNYCGMLSYRLKNLCVKAEEVSLLPIQVLIDGEMQNLEKCTTIAKKDDYSFMIFPNFDEDIETLGIGILRVHPEFKQKIESMKVDSSNENGQPKKIDVRYILVTMPDVDKNRYDVLKEGVKTCYNECKMQMDMANQKADVRFTELSVGEEDGDLKKLSDARKKLNETWNGQRDKLYEDKLKEIEEAHNKWLTEKADRYQTQEERAANGEDVTYSMRMGQQDDDVN